MLTKHILMYFSGIVHPYSDSGKRWPSRFLLSPLFLAMFSSYLFTSEIVLTELKKKTFKYI